MANWKKDDIAVFKGYSDTSMTEADQILKVGDRVRIYSVDGDAIAAVPIVAAGEDARDGDTVYPDEIMTVEEWDAQVTAEKQGDTGQTADPEVVSDEEAAAAPNKGKGKAKEAVKAKAKKQAEAAPAAETPAPAKAKGKAKTEAPAPAPVQTAPTTAPDEVEVAHTASVAAILAEQDALAAAQYLVNRAEETDFTLGGVLADIQRTGVYQTLGFTGKRGFEDYIEQKLGLKYRKARYLISIYEYFATMGIDEAKLAAMGWSKAKELVGKVKSIEEFDAAAEFAVSHTRDELIEHLRTSTVDAGDGSETGPTAKLVKRTFALYEDQAQTVATALAAAKAQAETDSDSVALEYICAEWSNLSANQESLSMEDYIAIVQQKFGVELVPAGSADEAEEASEAA